MRATNHHGRGTAKHVSHKGFDAPHIDKSRSKFNLFWTCDNKTSRTVPDIRGAELCYYIQTYQAGLDAQNDKHKARRQYSRIRTMEDIYTGRNTQPEESFLYIGNKDNLGDVSPSILWKCVAEYVNWEAAYSKAHGNFYKPLSLGLHADENGQIHVHERGVYQYKDDSGDWRIGQARALEAAGIPLPDPAKPRDRYNNRKQSWDAVRREKWLDIVEGHGFTLEREPEAHRPHLPLEAWQTLQDALQDVEADASRIRQQAAEIDSKRAEIDMERQQVTAEADKIRKMRQAADREREALNSRRQALEEWERELEERESALEAREKAVERREAVLTGLGRERYQKALQERQTARETERIRMADAIAPIPESGKSRKRAGKHSPADRQME